jgi:hypothetical protein
MKKTRLLILLICLVWIGCESSDKVSGVYIFKYGTTEAQDNESLHKYTLSSLMCFNEDSIEFVRYEMDKTLINSQNETSYYEQEDSIIRIYYNGGQEILRINFRSTDSLILLNRNEDKSVLIPLPRYRQKGKELNIRKDFQKYGFKWNSKDDVIEFDSTGYFYWSQFSPSNFFSKRWELKSYENELFLLYNGYFTDLIHIQDYKDGVITGVMYSDKDKVVMLNPVVVKPTYDSEELIGEWKEILDEDIPPPPISDFDNFQLNEILNFKEQLLIRRKYNDSDTLKWFSTQFNNKIVVSGRIGRLGNQWNVVRLENDELTIQRYNDRTRREQMPRETIKFKRKINDE